MRTQAAGPAQERVPQRARLFSPAGLSYRGELGAALATAALLAQLMFAQLTLVCAIILTLTGRATRWRLHWLAVPAVLGLGWALADPQAAVAGFTAGPRVLAGDLTASVSGGRFAHAVVTVTGVSGQLPIALLTGTAEAGLLLWLGWRRQAADGSMDSAAPGPGSGRSERYLTAPRGGWRRGLIVMARRRAHERALSAGRSVTAEGCAIGVEPATGRLSGWSWAEAERGVLVCCNDPVALADVCQPAAAAAIRRRKAVVIIDRTGGVALAERLAAHCRAVSVPVRVLEGPTSGSLAPALGQAIRRREVLLVSAAAGSAADLAAVLTRLSDLGLRGDTMAWIHGCQTADIAAVGSLLALGAPTGTAVLLSTASDAAAAALAGIVELTVAAAPVSRDLALLLASWLPDAAQPAEPGWLDSPRTGPADGAGRLAATPFPEVAASRPATAQALIGQPAGTLAIVARNRPLRLAARCTPEPVRAGAR